MGVGHRSQRSKLPGNLHAPRVGQPAIVAKALAAAIPADFIIATMGLKDADGADLIDHFAVSPALAISITEIVPRLSQDGTTLSDHVGIVASLEERAGRPDGTQQTLPRALSATSP